jgi:DNA polymerase
VVDLSIDIETFSSIDLKKSGLYKYVQAPDFEVLLFAYSFNGAPVRLVDLAQGEELPLEVKAAMNNPLVVKHAYNAAFEWYCLSKFFGVMLPLSQWRCTMHHGLYCGFGGSLGAVGEAMGLPQDKRKLSTGMSLIRIFCTPCKPTKNNGNRTRTLPHHEPDKWQLFRDYCKQDVRTEMEVDRLLSAFPVPENEQRLWELDQIINTRGVRIDRALVDSALAVYDKVTGELKREASSLTGLDNPNSVAQLLNWYEEETGEELDNLRKDTVKAVLAGDVESDAVKRVLKIRQELAKTSVKKYNAMRDVIGDDDRARGLLQVYGANRTGRWAGRLVQVQNLPRNYLTTLGHARETAKARKIDTLKVIYGNIPDTLSQLIRTAFIPSEGRTFIVADFSAIEARVIAWLAGETWRQEVFATHGKIYEASASAMFGVPIEEVDKDLRQRGKVAELALGYQGAAGALEKMDINKQIDPEEYTEIVRRWRQANKRIVDLWYAVDNAAVQTVRTCQPTGVNGVLFSREGDYSTGQDFLTITLPSGRKLYYVKPFLAPNRWGNDSIHYHGMDQTTKKWGEQETYGGKLVENIVQAIARDCLAVAMQRLEACHYEIVMHIHDEVVIDVETADPEKHLRGICEIMGLPIPWAPGLLLRADGFVTDYYKKE